MKRGFLNSSLVWPPCYLTTEVILQCAICLKIPTDEFIVKEGGFRLPKIRQGLTTVIAILMIQNVSFAQSNGRNENTVGPRRQLATIIFAGLSGAILGLSTLSFYGRPQERLSNIAVGFALGIFAGTIYTTYKAASKPQEFYGSSLFENSNNREELEMFKGQQDYRFTPLAWQFEF